jgi:hypothetical protein
MASEGEARDWQKDSKVPMIFRAKILIRPRDSENEKQRWLAFLELSELLFNALQHGSFTFAIGAVLRRQWSVESWSCERLIGPGDRAFDLHRLPYNTSGNFSCSCTFLKPI